MPLKTLKSGYIALISILIISSLLELTIVSLSFISFSFLDRVEQIIDKNQRYYAALSCAEYAVFSLSNTVDANVLNETEINFDTYSCEIKHIDLTEKSIITESETPLSETQLKVFYNSETFKIVSVKEF
jgi:hypothetical protein